jgi:hypothetical protein
MAGVSVPERSSHIPGLEPDTVADLKETELSMV